MNLSPNAPIVYIGTNHNDGEGKKFFSFVLDVLRPELAPHGIAVTTSILTNHAKGLLCWVDRTAAIVNIVDEGSDMGRCRWVEGNHDIPVIAVNADFSNLPTAIPNIIEAITKEVKVRTLEAVT